jgi:hypothetical protein
MSEEDGQVEGGSSQGPSMEDVLSSIRRILSEPGAEAEDEPEPEPESDPGPEPEPEPVPEPVPEVVPEPENVLELTSAMIVPPKTIVSGQTTEESADILSELARAILNQRDMQIGGSALTIEGMVREMLRPVLREWLDRNLPYLIERLVKKEIDHMINRAEKLDL